MPVGAATLWLLAQAKSWDFGRNVAQWAINEGVPTPLNLILVQQKLQSSNSNRVNRNLTHALSLFHKPVPNLA